MERLAALEALVHNQSPQQNQPSQPANANAPQQLVETRQPENGDEGVLKTAEQKRRDLEAAIAGKDQEIDKLRAQIEQQAKDQQTLLAGKEEEWQAQLVEKDQQWQARLDKETHQLQTANQELQDEIAQVVAVLHQKVSKGKQRAPGLEGASGS